MTPILDRIRAKGGEVTLDRWHPRMKRGRLSDDALAWVRAHRDDLMREVWPAYDDWQERAAVMEYDAEMTREGAEAAAHADVTGG